MVQLVENELLTIRFTNGNTLGGTASCNRYGGEYHAMINGDLLITKIFSTEIACLQPSNGDLFLQSLSNVDSYKVANGRLILLFEKSGKLQLRERYN